MRKTERIELRSDSLVVDIEGLRQLIGTGRATAEKIGDSAGASFKIGRRKLYHVDKVKKYLDSITI